MDDWVNRLFLEHSDLFLKLLNLRWSRTEELVNGIVRVLSNNGITSGNLLDLCCGNGRISIHMAKRGFRAYGIDISRAFLEDAGRKARENGVSDLVTFVEGDVRNLKDLIKSSFEPFDVVVNAWTSIGYYSEEEDLSIFRQARESSRKGSILIIAETMHTEFLSLKFAPTSFMEIEDLIMLENRKYDPTTSRINTVWTFYQRKKNDLKFIDSVEYQLHAYSLSRLCDILRQAGWDIVASYGSLSTLQQMTPLSSLNVVAQAI
ncbi:methyltransferase domain-containing protein [Candidatus Bathyarchaeota archaeon]|nr:methyltransferase domain-containing protein [Candidatus Bathyarchaeota archaeon]